MAHTHKKYNCMFFVIEKHIEDVKQEEKDVPDLVEAMRPTCLVKEELRLILVQLGQFRPKITKITVCTFQMSGKIPDSSPAPEHPFLQSFGRASGQIFKKCGF